MCKRAFIVHFYTVCVLFLCFIPTKAQKPDLSDSLNIKNGISKPNTLATHPFGILFYTLPHNFAVQPSQNIVLHIQTSSGNIWGQPVKTYLPSQPSDRAQLKNIAFYQRIFVFDPENSPAESYSFEYDGVVKDFRVNAIIPSGAKSDISITFRSFLLTDGKLPFTWFTGDQFIEFFHSNIAGGEDPFGRRRVGLDRSGIAYEDRKGNSLKISNGEFVFSGIESAYYYYPSILSTLNISMNIGVHMGINLSEHNSSMDTGLSIAAVKDFDLNQKNHFLVGLGLNVWRKGFLEFKTDQTDLGTSTYFGSFEGHIEFTKENRKNANHSIGLNYRIQTPYNTKKEEDYYVPFNPDRIARWHEASRHLYKFPSYWSLIYSYTKRTEWSIYLQQDMLVNNAPDLQLGVRFGFPLTF
ncbi:MAG: hypothetical protein AAGB24_11820 [Bacteroidota bacterium]